MRTAWKVALLGAFVLAFVEGVAAFASAILVRQGLLIESPSPDGYADYLARRHPTLGWPSPAAFGDGESEFDRSGSRIVPSHPDPGAASCVALFGDSFTWGDEVGPEDAYGNVLASQLGCRVANYGVGGFGTDQAFLRFRDEIEDPAPVVVLGHHSTNITRNVNQFRGYYTPGPFGLKPRFVLEEGRLALVPLPELRAEEYAALADRPELLPHDHFRPGGPAGVAKRSFPYAWSVARALGHYRLQARLRGEPSYAAFYEADHAAGGLSLTTAIFREFARIAGERGQRPFALLIPDVKDLQRVQQGGSSPLAPLHAQLAALDLTVIDPVPGLLAAAGAEDACVLYTKCSGGHFTPAGYALVADAVATAIGSER